MPTNVTAGGDGPSSPGEKPKQQSDAKGSPDDKHDSEVEKGTGTVELDVSDFKAFQFDQIQHANPDLLGFPSDVGNSPVSWSECHYPVNLDTANSDFGLFPVMAD